MFLLDGYKTYVVAAAIILIGIAEGPLGLDVPGIAVGDDWLAWVMSGLGLGSVRDAIRKLIDAFAGN